MSITDELRRWNTGRLRPDHALALDGIADRIDAEHGRKVRQAHADGLNEQIDYLERFVPSNYVLLPVDADGVPIHIGDRVENNERVVRIVLTDDSWEPSVYIEKLPNVLHEYFCHEVSHYQPDTWERIIEDAQEYVTDDEPLYSVSELVDRCRRLAGEV